MPSPKDPEKYARWIEKLKKRPPPWNKGKTGVYSEETLRKIGRASSQRVHSEETKRKISKAVSGENHPLWGTKHSQEWKDKISKSRKGKCVGREKTPEEREKLRKSMKRRREKFGYINSPETRRKISLSQKGKCGEKCSNWKGDDVKYSGLHAWINVYKPQSGGCEHCGRKTKWLDAANISGKYKRDVNDFIWLCRSCHTKMDNKRRKVANNGH